ncbi:hypothetical protein BCV70DRAFT_201475 [Testicularia cyperi]|uniref:Uncharacterized protein n=1 Tax=Testicularia cyperi TaxID=1882483 RepID=A0A317XK57_9BASI|nr:hypothetical protein BCV70DRAFT_201475 [Testicularia cyperi]
MRAGSSTGHATPNAATSSSIKPTGWIRASSTSTSVATPADRTALSDRTNLHKSTTPAPTYKPLVRPTTSIRSKPSFLIDSSSSSDTHTPGYTKIRRTPASQSHKGKATQSTLTGFFVPKTAPPDVVRARSERLERPFRSSPSLLSTTVDSPSDGRATRRTLPDSSTTAQAIASSSKAVSSPAYVTELAPDSDDEQLDQRARSLLRGRFGSIARSLDTASPSPSTLGRSEEPMDTSRARPKDSNAENVASATVPASSISTEGGTSSRPRPLPKVTKSPPPQPQPRRGGPSELSEVRRPSETSAKSTKGIRSVRTPEPEQPDIPVMDESLSNFTQPAWLRAMDGRAAFYQRLAGLPESMIRNLEEKRMLDQLQKAHRRMQSPGATEPAPVAAPISAQQTKRKLAGDAEMTEDIEAAPQRSGATGDRSLQTPICHQLSAGVQFSMPREAFRSPRSNRKVFVVETQFSSAGSRYCTSPSRRTSSTSGFDETQGGTHELKRARRAESDHTQVNLGLPDMHDQDDESETLPLPWDDAEMGEDTQLLEWEAASEHCEVDSGAESERYRTGMRLEVATSDDEDRLLQVVATSSPSSLSTASSSAPPSPSRMRTVTKTTVSAPILTVSRGGETSPRPSPQRCKPSSRAPVSNLPTSSAAKAERRTKVNLSRSDSPGPREVNGAPVTPVSAPPKRRRLASISPVTLAPTRTLLSFGDGVSPSAALQQSRVSASASASAPAPAPPAASLPASDRFGKLLTALHKEERRKHTGMQLNLDQFLPSSKSVSSDQGVRHVRDRSGLGTDLEEVLSDDDGDGGADGTEEAVYAVESEVIFGVRGAVDEATGQEQEQDQEEGADAAPLGPRSRPRPTATASRADEDETQPLAWYDVETHAEADAESESDSDSESDLNSAFAFASGDAVSAAISRRFSTGLSQASSTLIQYRNKDKPIKTGTFSFASTPPSIGNGGTSGTSVNLIPSVTETVARSESEGESETDSSGPLALLPSDSMLDMDSPTRRFILDL